jgi:hypothetical protein
MLTKTLLIFAVLCAAILIGCSKSDTMDNSNATANSNKTMASPAKSSAASSGEKIGVPECDEYLAKYEGCAGKVPEAGRAAYNSAGEQMRASWKKLAANPATKGSLAAACKQATEAQAAAWKTYGCAN